MTSERLSRDEWLKKKQLEEARKAGTAPAEVDEEGRAINPHIPQYIAQAPWYYGTSGPSLRHQRAAAAEDMPGTLDPRNTRGLVVGAAPTKWRKGACTNCGSMTHDAKSCCDRPRAVGAKWTGVDMKPDEAPAPESAATYAAKRDRWCGYDPAQHSQVAEFFEKVDKERRSRTRESDAAAAAPDGGEREGDGLRQGTGYNDAPIQKLDEKKRTTVRNLRIREDTAKYLRNLDVNSAFYDPRTRAMRENPTPGVDPSQLAFAGDNFTRVSGDAVRFAEEQLHAIEAAERGQDVHMLAAPSQAELLHREFKVRKEALREQQRKELIDRYGGQEHLVPADEAAKLLLSQTEDYVEYSRSGKVVKGAAVAAGQMRSRWEEDTFVNNHTSVWGSWWSDGRWGYSCCHSLIKNSVCTGEAGKAAAAAAAAEIPAGDEGEGEEVKQEKSLAEQKAEKEASKTKEQRVEEERLKATEEAAKKERRLREALEEEDRRAKSESEEDDDEGKGKKRKYHSQSAKSAEVTEEQLEAYRLKRVCREDPMREFMDRSDSDDKDHHSKRGEK